MKIIYKPIPKYGDLFTLKQFIEHCKSDCLIDYDGIGSYAFKDKVSNKSVKPSDITGNYSWFDFEKGKHFKKKIPIKIDKSFTHVMWFNK